ncbi:Vesicle transport protein S20 [Blastocladiella emersonii ATCC 22665]|nr:Vesicle transport protein S20 [Blastocladiella emersonii ATCC 22665]
MSMPMMTMKPAATERPAAAPAAPPFVATVLAALHRHADTVQAQLAALTARVNAPGAEIADAEWARLAAPLRAALIAWQDEVTNAADVIGDLRGPERAKCAAALDENKQMKLIHEDSLRRLGIAVRAAQTQRAAERRRQLLLSESGADGADSAALRRRGRGAGSESTSSVNGTSGLSDDQLAQRAAAETTESLKRMTQLMAVELEKSTLLNADLSAQTRLVQKVQHEYTAMTALLRGSKHLLTELKARDRTDKLIIGFACLVFLAVVLYILKKRVFFFLFP